MEPNFTQIAIKTLQWQSQLERTSLGQEDQDELKAHLDDIIEELCQTSLNEDEIWSIAMKRIGSITALEEEFEKVNPDSRFRKNTTLLIYGAISMLFMQSLFILIPVFYYKEHLQSNSVSNSWGIDNFWPILFYTLIVLLISLILVLTLWAPAIMKYLGAKITKFSTISAFVSAAIIIISAFYLIQLLSVSALDSSGKIAPIFKTLTQIFYFALIAVIGYFVLISQKPNTRTLLAFNRRMNWKTALFLGCGAGLAVTFGFTYHVPFLPLLIGCPLFTLLGWMITYSKTPLINLFICQLYLMLLWLSELSGQYATVFSRHYLLILVFLAMGFSVQKIYNSFSINS